MKHVLNMFSIFMGFWVSLTMVLSLSSKSVIACSFGENNYIIYMYLQQQPSFQELPLGFSCLEFYRPCLKSYPCLNPSAPYISTPFPKQLNWYRECLLGVIHVLIYCTMGFTIYLTQPFMHVNYYPQCIHVCTVVYMYVYTLDDINSRP